MLVINDKEYPGDFVAQAVAAFEAAENHPSHYGDKAKVELRIPTEMGILSIEPQDDEFHSVYFDLHADLDQCTALGTYGPDDPDGIADLPLATLEIPDQGAEVFTPEGRIKNCPRLILFNEFESDASHMIFMDGHGLQIEDENV